MQKYVWSFIFFASISNGVFADDASIINLLNHSTPVLVNNSKALDHNSDCYSSSQTGCNKVWVEKCSHLSKRKTPIENLSFCTEDPTQRKRTSKTTQCLNGITDAIASSVLGPVELAMAVADQLQIINSTCKGNTKELRAEVLKAKQASNIRESNYMKKIYGPVSEGTWESLSCDQIAQIRLCRLSISKNMFCDATASWQRDAESNFSKSIFSKPHTKTSDELVPIENASNFSDGIVKVRFDQCAKFKADDKTLAEFDRKYFKEFRDSIAKDGSCGEAYDILLAEIRENLNFQLPDWTDPNVPMGCFSDEYLSHLYCNIAANVYMSIGLPQALSGTKILGKVDHNFSTPSNISKSLSLSKGKKIGEPDFRSLEKQKVQQANRDRFKEKWKLTDSPDNQNNAMSGLQQGKELLAKNGIRFEETAQSSLRIAPDINNQHPLVQLANTLNEVGLSLHIASPRSPLIPEGASAVVRHRERIMALPSWALKKMDDPEIIGIIQHEKRHFIESFRGSDASKLSLDVIEGTQNDILNMTYGSRYYYRLDEPFAYFQGGAIEKALTNGRQVEQLHTADSLTIRLNEIFEHTGDFKKNFKYDPEAGRGTLEIQTPGGGESRVGSILRPGKYNLNVDVGTGLSQSEAGEKAREILNKYREKLNRVERSTRRLIEY